MGDPKVIFWDVYNTLVTARRGGLHSLLRREADLRTAFERTVKNFSIHADPSQLQDLFLRGIEAERQMRIAEGVAHPEVRVDEIWFRILDKFQADEPPTLNFAREVALFFEKVANPKELQFRVLDVLTTFKKRSLLQGIISNGQFYTPIELSDLLGEASRGSIRNYESLFDKELVFFSYELGVTKPDLTAFQRAIEVLTELGIMPDDCVMIGNSPANDIAPAQHMGFRTVLFALQRPADSSVKADLEIHNLGQLLEWL
ncbi:MAG TPA: HAD family hydrolase [Verrucomicrobiae bacterium]|nr:HAD family hydrolase [Verrucomicrobiae bacterium]